MVLEMRELDQQIIKFEYEKNFKDDDFYVSKSNQSIFNLLTDWPRWEKKFLNICGEKYSGKTHLVNIFLKKFDGYKINSDSLNDNCLRDIKIYQNVVVENLDINANEKLIYSLFNLIDQDNKYLIITSTKPVVDIDFKLPDLRSRLKNFLLYNIEQPDDELIYALIMKNLSDRQIILDEKLIQFLIKRIDRSYGKIFDFIYKIDELSLKKKKSIDLKIIKEVLGE